MKNILFYILSCIYFITINLDNNIYSDEHIRRVLLIIMNSIIMNSIVAYTLRLAYTIYEMSVNTRMYL